MYYRAILRAVLFILLAMSFAACGLITDQADPVDVGELSQTFTGEDSFGGSLTVNYPEGWAQDGDANNLLLASSSELLEDNLQTNPTGDDAIALVSILPENLASTMVNNPAETSSVLILESFKQSLEQGANPIDLGEIEPITINGREGAITKGSSAQGDNLILMLDMGNAYINLVGITAEGQIERYREAFVQIAGSVSYETPDNVDASDTEIDVEGDPEDILEATAEATEATDE